MQEISPGEVKELFPLARTDDILAGFYVAEDGRANPVDVTMSLGQGRPACAARRSSRACRRTGVLTRGGAVTGVRTPYGDIEAEYVVNCAGMWARQLGAEAGVTIPLQAAEHYYLITEPIDGMDGSLPVLEDPVVVRLLPRGGRRADDRAVRGRLRAVAGRPASRRTSRSASMPPDWDRMAPYLEKAMARVPVSFEAGVRTFFCGPESFTPDLPPIVGEAPELRNYFVAAGLNSIGILTGGGIGRALAHWIVDGRPGHRRHRDEHRPAARLPDQPGVPRRRARSSRSGMVYQRHYPGRSMQTARGAKLSPLHDRLVARRAYFRDVSGWEGADWYAPEGVEPVVETLSWGRQNWFPYWEAEHRAAREGVILMDMSFMSKFLVQGRDAGRGAGPPVGEPRSTASRASSRTPSGSTRAARSRPT